MLFRSLERQFGVVLAGEFDPRLVAAGESRGLEEAVGVGFFEAAGFTRGDETRVELAGEYHPELAFEREL